jgi:threonine dehydrogenase-like Zn-dependent dehydrogenase
VALPLANLHAVPENVSDDQAVFVEPLAAAFQILEQVSIPSDCRVFVHGDGRLGLLCAMVLATAGCDLTVIGRHPEKLALLRAAGIDQVMLSQPDTYAALALEQADVVVEVTGSPAGFADALRLTRPSGTLVLKSTFAGNIEAFNVSKVVVDEITIVGSRCGPFPRALAALADRSIDVLPLIHARYPLRAGLDAFAHAQQKGVLKVLIDPRR